MNDWGGAQWLIIFILAIRFVLGAAKARGTLHVPVAVIPPWQQFWSARIADLALLVLLLWGGFF